jgi:tRNA pseudouridine38-40 synthase
VCAAVVPRNIRLTLEYDGSDFVGWQWQDNGPSIQAALERAIVQITGQAPTVRAAGRTDAGVHAIAQIVNFRTESQLPLRRLARGLNAVLPKTITVHRAEDVPDAFDAKRDSYWKRYRYAIYQAEQPAAHLAKRAWHLIAPLDLARMREAANDLIGERDFESFRATHCQAEHARRHMFAIDIERHPRPPAGALITITYCADAFCRHMCRILTGTLVEVGRRERDSRSMPDILAARRRNAAGVTAPAHGLCLLEVGYDDARKERNDDGDSALVD